MLIKRKIKKSVVIIFIFMFLFIFNINNISKGISNLDNITSNECIENIMIKKKMGTIILTIIPLAIFIIVSVISIVRFFILKFKINKKNIDEKEKEEEKKALKKGLANWIMITGIISFFLRIIQSSMVSFDKPLIYLYPKKEEKITVKLGKEEKLTCTYPKYTDKWEVIAKPNGELTDLSNGRKLYGLYWEGKCNIDPKMEEGFCVAGKDIIPFLEKKLNILGMSEREINEFIIYWLPKLEKNKYNFIRFETLENIEKEMPLEITPTPDTIIRVLMVFKGLKKEIKIKEQILTAPMRNGFVAVEWGGTEIK